MLAYDITNYLLIYTLSQSVSTAMNKKDQSEGSNERSHEEIFFFALFSKIDFICMQLYSNCDALHFLIYNLLKMIGVGIRKIAKSQQI